MLIDMPLEELKVYQGMVIHALMTLTSIGTRLWMR